MQLKLLALAIVLCCPLVLPGQINSQKTNQGFIFLPNTTLLPTTQITPSGITTDQPLVTSDFCTTLEMDTAEFKQLPWYGDEQYLDNLLDSVGYPFPNGNPCTNCRIEDGVRFRIPLQFWVYNNNAGNDLQVPDELALKEAVDRVNRDHRNNNTGIRFYIRCGGISQVNNDGLQDIWDFESLNPPFNRNTGRFAKGPINIHIFREGGNFYNPLVDAIFIDRDNGLDNTLSHEIGHALGLMHTHFHFRWRNIPLARRRFVEPIDRSRNRFSLVRFRNIRICSETGDGLCDTPADPRLARGHNRFDDNFTGCNYNGDQTDPWGDEYDNPPAGSDEPDPENLMSYGQGCRDIFTREQIGVMIHRIERGRYRHFKNGYKSQDVVFDTFELNDNAEQARLLPLNNPEELTFHKSYSRSGSGVRYG